MAKSSSKRQAAAAPATPVAAPAAVLPQDVCVGCGQVPRCRLAEAAIVVVVRDYTGGVTSLCAKCGAADDWSARQVVEPATNEESE